MSQSTAPEKTLELTWVAKLPLARDPVFVRQMAMVFLLPLLVLGLILAVIEWPLDLQSLGTVLQVVLLTGAVLLVLYLLVIFGVLRGRQEIRYTLDGKGVHQEVAGPLKYMNWVKFLLVLSGKPTYAGIGLLATGPQSARLTWKRVESIAPDSQARTIGLRKDRTELLLLHCTEDNYEQVLARVESHTMHSNRDAS